MLWRPAYQTLVARDQTLPNLSILPCPKVLVGAFDFRAIREISIWQRLIQKDAAQVVWVQAFFLPSISDKEESMLEALVPLSQHGNTHLVLDPDMEWATLIEPAREDQAFACVIAGDTARIMMKGLPTEEAWDAFLAELD